MFLEPSAGCGTQVAHCRLSSSSATLRRERHEETLGYFEVSSPRCQMRTLATEDYKRYMLVIVRKSAGWGEGVRGRLGWKTTDE